MTDLWFSSGFAVWRGWGQRKYVSPSHTVPQRTLFTFCEPRWWVSHREVLVRPFHPSTVYLDHAELVCLCNRLCSKHAECCSRRMEGALSSRYPPFSEKKSKLVQRLSSPSFPPRDSVYNPRGWWKKWVFALLTLGTSLLWAQRKKLIAH